MSEQPDLGLLDRVKVGYNGDGATGLRHAISERVEAMIAEAWGLKDAPSSFSLVDRLCLLLPKEGARYSIRRIEIERIASAEPQGRLIGRMAN